MINKKKSKSKNKRRPYPKMKSKLKGGWIYFDSPGTRYFGGALHYVGKDGKIKHSNEFTVPKSEIMSLIEFRKRFCAPKYGPYGITMGS